MKKCSQSKAQRILENSEALEDGFCCVSCWRRWGEGSFYGWEGKGIQRLGSTKWKSPGSVKGWKTPWKQGFWDRSEQMEKWSCRKANWEAVYKVQKRLKSSFFYLAYFRVTVQEWLLFKKIIKFACFLDSNFFLKSPQLQLQCINSGYSKPVNGQERSQSSPSVLGPLALTWIPAGLFPALVISEFPVPAVHFTVMYWVQN